MSDHVARLRRMARCSRFWARAARATSAEFMVEFEAALARPRDTTLSEDEQTARSELLVDLRGLTVDKLSEAKNHDREAEELDAAADALERLLPLRYEVVAEALGNAIENQDDWVSGTPAEDVAADMIEKCADVEDRTVEELVPHIQRWQRERAEPDLP